MGHVSPVHFRVFAVFPAFFLSWLLLIPVSAGQNILPFSADSGSVKAEKIEGLYRNLPWVFEENRGQADSEAKFIARSKFYDSFLTTTGVVFRFRESNRLSLPFRIIGLQPKEEKPTLVKLAFLGSFPDVEIIGETLKAGSANYFIGNDPSVWKTGIQSFEKVRYKNLYPGIDLVFYGKGSSLEYDFIIAPRADPQSIRFRFDNAEKIEKMMEGDLLIRAGEHPLRVMRPSAYQSRDGKEKTRIISDFCAEGSQWGFRLGTYDPDLPLIIDPVLTYSTLLAGSRGDESRGVAVDTQGSIYVFGRTQSVDFPLKEALQQNFSGFFADMFVLKLNSQGSALVYSTFIGGSDQEDSFEVSGDIVVDGEGNASLTVDLNGETVEGTKQVAIPANGIVTLETDGKGTLQAGTARVVSDGEISGVILFRGFGTAGVLGNQRLRQFRVPVRTGDALNSGVALMSLGKEQIIELTLRDPAGELVATSSEALVAKGHEAKFVTEVQWSPHVDFTEFLGTLSASSPEDFAATAILVTESEFATLPVKVSEEPDQFFFAQFGDGTGEGVSLSSQILLFNLSSQNAARPELLLHDNVGDPLTVDFNGEDIDGYLEKAVPPDGIILLATDGKGALTVGSVEVSSGSEGRLSGAILFRGFGLAAVLANQSSRKFRAPMRVANNLNSGIAVRNAGAGQMVRLELRGADGSLIATAFEQLKRNGHFAKFVNEFAWDSAVDFGDFTGTLSVIGQERLAATVILVTEDEFATLPVIPMK